MEYESYETSKEFDALAAEYDDTLQEVVGNWVGETEKFAEYKVQLLHMIVSEGAAKPSILDFGCGIGRSLSFFKKYFCDASLFGCDVSSASLEMAKKNAPFVSFFLNDSIEALYAQRKKWDIVFLACVMHHIEPLERTEWLKAIVDNMAEDGYLAIFEHNILNPFTKRIIQHPLNEVDRMEWMMTPETVVSYIRDDRLPMKLHWKGYTCFFPWRWAGATAVERYLKWCPLGAQHCEIFEKVSV